MENLIIILSEEFVRQMQVKLSKYNPWTESFIKVKKKKFFSNMYILLIIRKII